LPPSWFPAALRATAGTVLRSCDRRGQSGDDAGTNRDDEERIDRNRQNGTGCIVFGPDHFYLSCVSFQSTKGFCFVIRTIISPSVDLSINIKFGGRNRKISFFDINFPKCDKKWG
jgi:hypothetical protein